MNYEALASINFKELQESWDLLLAPAMLAYEPAAFKRFFLYEMARKVLDGQKAKGREVDQVFHDALELVRLVLRQEAHIDQIKKLQPKIQQAASDAVAIAGDSHLWQDYITTARVVFSACESSEDTGLAFLGSYMKEDEQLLRFALLRFVFLLQAWDMCGDRTPDLLHDDVLPPELGWEYPEAA